MDFGVHVTAVAIVASTAALVEGMTQRRAARAV
jgi:hypothetical protein